MRVDHFERARFRVTGSQGEIYTVDCLTYDGNGRCTCLHFTCRIEPEIKRLKSESKFKPGPITQCKHIEASDRALLRMFKKQLIEKFPDNNLETT